MAINISDKLYAATEQGVVCEAGQVEGLDELLEKNIIVKKTDLLYNIKYSVLDYDFAKNFFKTKYLTLNIACSVVRSGNKIGRNLDWYYNNEVEFIIETESGLNRHAVKGFAGTIPTLTKDYIQKNTLKGEIAKILPFRLLDGINDCGLMCNVNVVNQNTTKSISDNGTTPIIEQKDEICTLMIVRYILDNFKSVDEACEYIKNYVKVYAPTVEGVKTEVQVFLADKTTSKVLSFEGENVIINEDTFHGVLTNFRLSDTVLDNNGLYSIDNSNIEDYGSGIERANIALEMLDNNDELNNIMDSLKYTHTYNIDSHWYTEFVGISGTTIHSDIEIFEEIQEKAIEKYNETTREKSDIWHTTHTIIYDLDNLSAEYITQEINDGNSISGSFEVLNYYTKEDIDNAHFAISDSINDINIIIKDINKTTENNVYNFLKSLD